MEMFFITILVLLLLICIYKIQEGKKKIKSLNKENYSLSNTISLANTKVININEAIDELKISVENIKQEKRQLEIYLDYFVNGRIRVYVRSNFHSNFNVYNNKFYAKVSGRTTSTKVEGIPVLTLHDNKYDVIDLYKFKKLQRQFPDDPILLNLEQSRTKKEDLIQELGNKVLTSYSQ